MNMECEKKEQRIIMHFIVGSRGLICRSLYKGFGFYYFVEKTPVFNNKDACNFITIALLFWEKNENKTDEIFLNITS